MSFLTLPLRHLVLFLLQISSLVFLITYYYYKNNIENVLEHIYDKQEHGCQIPVLQPFDPSFQEAYVDFDSYRCRTIYPEIILSNLTSIYVNNNITYDRKKLSCCYRPFIRVKPLKATYHDSMYGYFDECYVFRESARVETEFVRVSCKYGANDTIYTNYIAFVPYRNTTRNITKGMENKKLYNILILSIDSCSRMCIYRHMPQTLSYLKNNLSMVEFERFQKVGSNTFPNLIGLLTGDDVKALQKKCWPRNDMRFDECEKVFIWKQLRSGGYLTSYAEDGAWGGTFQNDNKKGFYKDPTDYTWRTFSWVSEKEAGTCLNGTRTCLAKVCIGGRHVHKILMEYTLRLVESTKIRNQSYHAIHWSTSLSHEDNTLLNLGDADFVDFLHQLLSRGFLEDTVLLFMSDHGIRFGKFRQTYPGSLEERLPFLFIRLPESFKSQYPDAFENIKKNSKHLVTHFDLYQTQLDILNHHELKNISGEMKPAKSMSLFRPIPGKRTCSMAGIDPSICVCHPTEKIDVNYPTVLKAAIAAVNHINEMLVPHRKCSQLKLHKINLATVSRNKFKYNNVRLKYFEDYKVMFETKPGTGSFEATVRRYSNKSCEIVGIISRVSAYANENDCIMDYEIKQYCYCKNLIL